MNITIQFGARTFTREFDDGTSVGQVTGNTIVRSALGFGDSVRVLCQGSQVLPEVRLHEDTTLVVETAAQTKAAKAPKAAPAPTPTPVVPAKPVVTPVKAAYPVKKSKGTK